MDSRRIRNLRNSFDRNIVDKQVDKFLKLEDNSLMEYLVLGQVKEGTQIFKE